MRSILGSVKAAVAASDWPHEGGRVLSGGPVSMIALLGAGWLLQAPSVATSVSWLLAVTASSGPCFCSLPSSLPPVGLPLFACLPARKRPAGRCCLTSDPGGAVFPGASDRNSGMADRGRAVAGGGPCGGAGAKLRPAEAPASAVATAAAAAALRSTPSVVSRRRRKLEVRRKASMKSLEGVAVSRSESQPVPADESPRSSLCAFPPGVPSA